VAASKPKCDGINKRGGPCAAPVMDDARWCFFHSPETRTEAAEARRLGGLRRRREGALAGAYDFEGIASVPQVRRVLEIAISDALGLENSLARSRTLGTLAVHALKALEVGEFEARLEVLEATIKPRLREGRRR
jgi:hypothetical protein